MYDRMRRSIASLPGNHGSRSGGIRVDEVGAAQRRHADVLLTGSFEQLEHDVTSAAASAAVNHLIEGAEPLSGLVGVDVWQLGRQTLMDDGRTFLAGLRHVHSQLSCGRVHHSTPGSLL